ncbi:2-oxoglutarate dehydrogenase E2 component [Roseimicrobium gellanilyticum]|uniref:Dihydrolipoyllysine-residue succinyltransferase n=1 Tax=Roseimicrobium gellanilyticum TaxID=748857 RepID=A0A366HVS6_9BACT|nr:2-oxoglutarate dehydrogenase complex dihydrolipoyllysine-residue succinyltransferase [Roseimicrobium gellanilyticum]RBP47674.1 2-oxoglutarate dehydrogenase E2 component [Roseimicrobium gellanilyticum]
MSTEVKIPTLGESIAGGLISKWHKNDGDAVKAGDVLLTLETDKVAQEIAAEADGVLRQKAKEGDEVEVGAVVALIEAGAAAPAAAAPAPAPKEPEKAATPAPAAKAAEPAPAPAAKKEEAPKAEAAPQLKLVPKPEAEAAPAPAPKPTPSPEGRTTRKKMTPLRRKIAEQLVNAQRTAAILTTFNECDMSEVMTLRKVMQDDFVKKHGVKLGFMSFFVKAVVDALKSVPQINTRVDGDEIISNNFYDIGVAVGTEKGLIVPVIRDADQKSFADIEKDIIAYAKKAKEGKIAIDDLTGGVFTISNGGVYGSLLSTPILNPPQSGILGLHAIKERPVAENGQVVIRPMMNLALSYDHRVVDGKEAVTFLIRVKDCIEKPARLLVGV